MSPTIASEDDPQAGQELAFKTRGWIHGHEILGAESRGARLHILRPCAEPSEEARQWSVSEQALGRLPGGAEAVALLCRRRGLFGGEDDAAIAVKTWEGGKVRLEPAAGSLRDRGGSWVPRAGVGAPGTEEALDLARLEWTWGDISAMPIDAMQALRSALDELIGLREAGSESVRAKLAQLLAAKPGAAPAVAVQGEAMDASAPGAPA